jgi:hypothetical protein
MTDRELLELAAKAAGLLEMAVGDKDIQRYLLRWNPLTDDGDALRLAVKLGLAVSIEYQFRSTSVLWGPPTGYVREDHDNDPDAATRRAIVRAAAEIGRQMK